MTGRRRAGVGRWARAALLAGLLLAAATLGGRASGQTVVEFWHAHGAVEDVIQGFADAFNASQGEVRVEPRYVGSYNETALRLVAALRSGGAPALVTAEGTVLARLAADGALAELSARTEALPRALRDDLEPAIWEAGGVAGGRYGLPWNASIPVLVYNASVLRQLGVAPPADWAAFEAAADRLTTRNADGYIDVAAAFIFEAMVASRGGRIVTEEGRPDFVSPEAIATLEMLARMARAGHSLPRSFADFDQALIDFARGKGMMAIAGQALLPEGERFAVTFDVATAPIPRGEDPGVPITGGQLVIPRAASEAERAGAFAFWRFLMEPARNEAWVKASFFLPSRRSVREGLADWYAAAPVRSAGVEQLPYAVQRPDAPGYALWQTFLEEAIERVTIGGADPEEALREAQRRALEEAR